MKNKIEKRSEETKNAILREAAELFSKKGYDAVTIREIAKEAGCSHTTIYIYFKDKEALLHELSMPALRNLHQLFVEIVHSESLSDENKLRDMSKEYIRFCLTNRNMYEIFFNTKSSKVDEANPQSELNKLRIELFQLMTNVLKENLNMENEEPLLAFSRIYYYNLNGILATYSYLHEPVEELMERLTSTFDLNVEILLLGFKEKLKIGE